MKRHLASLAACALALAMTVPATAQDMRPLDVRYISDARRLPDDAFQRELRQSDAWKNFLARHGEWYVIYNENNQKPHRAFGKPIPAGVQGDAESMARHFIRTELAGFGVPADDLELSGAHESDKYIYVNFRQRYRGLEVRDSRLTVKMTRDGRVVMFGLDVFSDINISPAPALPQEAALEGAAAGITQPIGQKRLSGAPQVLPVPAGRSSNYRLVYEATVESRNETDPALPAVYEVLVDANTGDIVSRTDQVMHHSDCSGEGGRDRAQGTAVIEADISVTSPWDPAQAKGLPYVEVNDGTLLNADANGNVAFSGNPSSVTVTLQGPYAVVYNGAAGTTGFSHTASGLTGGDTVSVNGSIVTEARSAYYHVNIIHDYMRTKFTSWTDMDIQMVTRVQRTDGTCNAFYNGGLNFYTTGGGCYSYALVGDVVYHEYGHGINSRYYQSKGTTFNNGGMGEGYSDIWAIGVTEFPHVGKGGSQTSAGTYIRRYDGKPKVYPQDLVGEVHADGEIIAGAWYDVAVNFGSVQDMMALFAATYNGLARGPNGTEGAVYTDILIDALQEDDDNGDLTDGTPRAQAIVDAFDRHGITLLSNATVTHTDITQAPASTPIDITADVTFTYAWALQDVSCFYRLNANAQVFSVAMTNTGGSTYSAQIPGQSGGTLIGYYIGLQDIYGKLSGVVPVGADKANANIPYFILTGFTWKETEDFDVQWGAWQVGAASDNATTGLWIIDLPVPSYSDLDGNGAPDVGDPNALVQMDDDFTPGGVTCALTGNANTANDGIGTNDVDGGSTTLISPAFDLTGMTNPLFTYRRWYVNGPAGGANPGNDWFHVHISNDGGSTWVPLEVTNVQDRSWRRYAFRVKDIVTPSAAVKLRFIASDSLHPGQGLPFDGGSIVEAGIDDLELWDGDLYDGTGEAGEIHFALYPNPSQGDLFIETVLAAGADASVEFVNALGQPVQSVNLGRLPAGSHRLRIPAGDLAEGIYLVRFTAGSVARTVRVAIAAP